MLLTRDGFIFHIRSALHVWGLLRAVFSSAVSVMWCRRLVGMTHTAFADQVTANAPARAARTGASPQHHQTMTAVSARSRTATTGDGCVFGAPPSLAQMHEALPSAALG